MTKIVNIYQPNGTSLYKSGFTPQDDINFAGILRDFQEHPPVIYDWAPLTCPIVNGLKCLCKCRQYQTFTNYQLYHKFLCGLRI